MVWSLKKNSIKSILVYFILSINMLILLYAQTTENAGGQLSGEMTTTCTSEGDCITVICIDDKFCEKITTNSNNSTELRDYLENNTNVSLMPKDIA
jgi:hypothetical protein